MEIKGKKKRKANRLCPDLLQFAAITYFLQIRSFLLDCVCCQLLHESVVLHCFLFIDVLHQFSAVVLSLRQQYGKTKLSFFHEVATPPHPPPLTHTVQPTHKPPPTACLLKRIVSEWTQVCRLAGSSVSSLKTDFWSRKKKRREMQWFVTTIK